MQFDSVHDDGGGYGSSLGRTSDLAEFDFDPIRYSDFGISLDHQLDELVQRWQYLAAPCAMRRARFEAKRDR